MRTLYYQCGAGISGDMHLGAMVDLGVPQAVLREGLARLPCADEFQMAFARSQKMGITGVRAQVRDLQAAQRGSSGHRHYRDIVALIEAAGLQAGVQRRALAIFEQIAVAEAKIHDIPVHKVHFHEVGAVDAIVDIVGAALALAYLDVQHVCCGLVEVGSGFVDCAHGRLPVPAPATQEILSGVPCSYGGVLGEATTPTGAAILKVVVDSFQPLPVFSPQRVGYGLGTRDFTIPNVLRVVLGESRRLRRAQRTQEDEAAIQPGSPEAAAEVSGTADADQGQASPMRPTPAERAAPEGVRIEGGHCKLEANLDDLSPEAYEPLMEHLLALGASDVYLTPIIMKKSRPAVCLAVLCEAHLVDELAEAVFNRSTTIGLRVTSLQKQVLTREIRRMETRHGPVRVKLVTQPDGRRRWKAEHEDVRNIAEAEGLDYLQARTLLDAEIAKLLADG